MIAASSAHPKHRASAIAPVGCSVRPVPGARSAALLVAFLTAVLWASADAMDPCPPGTAPKAAKTLGCALAAVDPCPPGTAPKAAERLGCALAHCCWNPQKGANSGHKCRLDGGNGERCPQFKAGGTSRERAEKTTVASEDYTCERAQPLDDCERTSGRHVIADETASDDSTAVSGGLSKQRKSGGLRAAPTTLIKEGKDACPMEACIEVCNQVPGQGATIGGTVKSTFLDKPDFNVFCTSHNFKTGADEGGDSLTGCLVYTPTEGHPDQFPGVQSGNYIDAVCGLPKRGAAPPLINALKSKGGEVHLTCVPCSDTPYGGDMDSCNFRLDQYYANKLGFSYWKDEDDSTRKQMRDFNIVALMSWNP